VGVAASLWQSDFVQYPSSTFTENSVALTWAAQTSLLPDTDQITNNTITEGSIDMALPATNETVSVSFNDRGNSPIASIAILPMPSGVPAIWGSSTWGGFQWGGGGLAALAPYQLTWPQVMTFVRGSLLASSRSTLGFKLSTIHLRYQPQRSWVNTGLAA
jgi:hypothetical protein